MSTDPNTDSHPATDRGFFRRLIGQALAHPYMVLVLTAAMVVCGLAISPMTDLELPSINPIPVDALPDLSDNQQIVTTAWPGYTAQDVEDQITWPLTNYLLGIPGVRTVRSFSMVENSTIYVIFDDAQDVYWTRSRVAEALASIPSSLLPANVTPQLGPAANALGQVLWYTLQGRDEDGNPAGGWDPQELRTLQDYVVAPALAGVPGVAEVASVGGYVEEFLVEADPWSLYEHGLTWAELVQGVRSSNAVAGAGMVEIAGVEHIARADALVVNPSDIASTILRLSGSSDLRIADVARVTSAPAPRRGLLDLDGAPAVGGVVVTGYDTPVQVALADVHERIAALAPSLPERRLDDGRMSRVTIVPHYDRGDIIQRTIGTLRSAIWQQLMITAIVVMVMLVHLRGATLVAITLPVSLSMTFLAMWAMGLPATIVSMSGIAIAIGTVVDVGIVIAESNTSALAEVPQAGVAKRLRTIANATAEVAPAVTTSLLTTMLSFLPILLLTGTEGRLFVPLALTKTFVVGSSLFAGVIITPVIAVLLLRPQLGPLDAVRGGAVWAHRILVTVVTLALVWLLAHNWQPMGANQASSNLLFCGLVIGGVLVFLRIFVFVYPWLLGFALRHKLLFMALPVSIVLMGMLAWQGGGALAARLPASIASNSTVNGFLHHFEGLGQEFMPQLNEGQFLVMPSTTPHASTREVQELLSQLDQAIRSVPEVEFALGKAGRANSALDPAPLSMIETVVGYVPEYVQNERGQRLLFAVDPDGEFERDADGELVPSDRGQPYRQWRDEIRTSQDIWDEIVAATSIPGLTGAPFLQPISARIVMLQSGIRSPLAIGVRGDNLEELTHAAAVIAEELRQVPTIQTSSISTDLPTGKPWIEVLPDRVALRAYRMSPQAVVSQASEAIGGVIAGVTIDGRRRIPIRVRYPREARDNPEAIGRTLIDTPGGPVPLQELAEVRWRSGPQMLRSEQGQLTVYVMFGPAAGFGDVDAMEAVVEYIDAARDDGRLQLPAGVTLDYAGTWQDALRARSRLAILIPMVLLCIWVLLAFQFGRISTVLSVFAAIGVTLSGAFLGIWVIGQPWFLNVDIGAVTLREVFQLAPTRISVAVWVGMIALFGIATDDGVVMTSYLDGRRANERPADILSVRNEVLIAGQRRIVPCLMTTGTTILALLPVMTSVGTGADLMRPMAIPLLSGMVTELVTLFMVPVFYSYFWERQVRRSRPTPALLNERQRLLTVLQSRRLS
jgi:Cu(I)/Ag(I) efflux system membrane protein CusA/SilA